MNYYNGNWHCSGDFNFEDTCTVSLSSNYTSADWIDNWYTGQKKKDDTYDKIKSYGMKWLDYSRSPFKDHCNIKYYSIHPIGNKYGKNSKPTLYDYNGTFHSFTPIPNCALLLWSDRFNRNSTIKGSSKYIEGVSKGQTLDKPDGEKDTTPNGINPVTNLKSGLTYYYYDVQFEGNNSGRVVYDENRRIKLNGFK
jgi:hypothetical protein